MRMDGMRWQRHGKGRVRGASVWKKGPTRRLKLGHAVVEVRRAVDVHNLADLVAVLAAGAVQPDQAVVEAWASGRAQQPAGIRLAAAGAEHKAQRGAQTRQPLEHEVPHETRDGRLTAMASHLPAREKQQQCTS